MVPTSNYANSKCKYCNTVTGLCCPVCFRIEDKPFGIEMRYGRGVCDTEPIKIYETNKPCETEDEEFVAIYKTNINTKDIDFGRRKKEVEKHFSDNPTTLIISAFEFGTLFASVDRDRKKLSCKENEQKSKERENFFEKSLQENDVKPVGPFTEPPNPGKQMKLGEPYNIRSRLKKDFYKDF